MEPPRRQTRDHPRTPPIDWEKDKGGNPPPQLRAQTARGQEEVGDRPRAPTTPGMSQEEGRNPLYGSVRSQRMACLSRKGGTPQDR